MKIVSNVTRNKKVDFQNKRNSNRQNENKPIYRNKAEAKKELDRFLHGGTSIYESAKFQNNECFLHKKFHDKKFERNFLFLPLWLVQFTNFVLFTNFR